MIKIKLFAILILLTFSVPEVSLAGFDKSKPLVKMIYFQPEDAPEYDDSVNDDIRGHMFHASGIFALELEKYGHGFNTFGMKQMIHSLP